MSDDRRKPSRKIPSRTILTLLFVLIGGSGNFVGAWAQESASGGVKTGAKSGASIGLKADHASIKGLGGPNPVRVLEGNARLTMPYEETVVVFRADTIAMETATEIITATGNVTIEDGTHTIRSATMVYNAKNRRGHFSGGVPGAMGVQLTQKTESGEENQMETDWLTVTFGEAGIEEIETGPVAGGILLTGEEPLPIGVVEPATGEKPVRSTESLPRSIAPPPIDE